MKLLRDHDPAFSVKKRKGKGSHRAIVREGSGQGTTIIPFHGNNGDVHAYTLNQLIKRFKLPDGIFD